MDSALWTYHVALPQKYPTVYIGVWENVSPGISFGYTWDSISSLFGNINALYGFDDAAAGLSNTLINENRVHVVFSTNRHVAATTPDHLGKIIYRGTLERWESDLEGGGVAITVQPEARVGRQTRISTSVSGDTALSLRNLIYNSGVSLLWDDNNPKLSGVTFSATYVDTPFMDIAEQLAIATGDSWYTGVTPRNTVLFVDTNSPSNVSHKLAYGYEVIKGKIGKSSEHVRRKVTTRYQTTAGAQTSASATASTFNALDPREEVILMAGQQSSGSASAYATAALARFEAEYIVGELVIPHQRYDTTSFELGHRVNIVPYRNKLPPIVATLEPETAKMIINGITWSEQTIRLTLGLVPQSLVNVGAISSRDPVNYLKNLA